MVIKFWGTRGSIPVPGPSTIKYGGNTPCVEIKHDDEFIIIDAGTGIRNLGKELVERNGYKDLSLLISHTHWDHIQGLPFFKPLYQPECRLNIYSDAKLGASIDQIFETQWDPNYFPVTADLFEEKLKYKKIESGDIFDVNGFNIHTIKTNHSKGTLAFKIIRNGKSIVYMTDNELSYEAERKSDDFDKLQSMNSGLIEFCKNADYLIHDSMYSLKDYKGKIGWGHSNNVSLAHFATLAKVKHLILFHYEPEYDDDKIDNLISDTRFVLQKINSNTKCIGSYDLLELEV